MKKSFVVVILLIASGVCVVLISKILKSDEKETVSFLGIELPKNLYCGNDPYSVRDLYIEDVPGSESYWLGPWVQVLRVNGIERFYVVKGYNRFYVDGAFPDAEILEFYELINLTKQFYGPFQGSPSDYFPLEKVEIDELGIGAQPAVKSTSRPKSNQRSSAGVR